MLRLSAKSADRFGKEIISYLGMNSYLGAEVQSKALTHLTHHEETKT